MQRSLLVPSHPAVAAGSGPALLGKGFRLFFLLAGLHAIVAVPLWLLVLRGHVTPVPYLEPVAWHAHEVLFGFVAAVVAGFLLTAVGNWTQRETAVGAPLAALGALWLAGRAGLLFAGLLPRGWPALLDLGFLPALGLTLARPLLASGNRRNFVMLALLAALFGVNLVVHASGLGWLDPGAARQACLVGVDVIALMMLIMAGRVFPMFTRNATNRDSIRSSPALDRATVLAMLGLLLVDAFAFNRAGAGALVAGVVALLALLRARHWGARYCAREPLLWILHAGYGWLVVGLAARALAGWGWVSAPVATHALTVGAIGSLTLGMMARVALGHSGRLLTAPAPMVAAFVALQLAALTRTLVPWLMPAHYFSGLIAAGVSWTLAFAIFLFVYAPYLLQPRVDGRPG